MGSRIPASVLFILIFTISSHAQYGDPEYRGINQMDGNLIRTTFYNYGLLGNIGEISFEWPIGTGNEYCGDFTPLLGAEFVHYSGDTLHSVINCYGPRGNADGPPGGGAFWGFEPVPGYAQWPSPGSDPVVARSDEPASWPSAWNGQWFGPSGMGTRWGDQEAYFQMDDHRDLEWREREGEILYPILNDTSRGGIGLRVEVRYLQYEAAELADALFLMYILHNDGQLIINRARFGFLIGTMAGGRQDSEDDITSYNADLNLTYSFDPDDQGSPGWTPVSAEHNVGYFGTMFLKTPAREGLTSFDVFTPPGAVRMRDDEGLWQRMEPGRFDIIGQPSDCDYVMGTGDFPLWPGAADTVIAVVLYGVDYDDLVDNAHVVIQRYSTGAILGADSRKIIIEPSTYTLSAYPNPFNGELTLDVSGFNREVRISLLNMLGQEVDVIHSGVLSGSRIHYAAPAQLSSGLYFVKAADARNARMEKVVFLK